LTAKFSQIHFNSSGNSFGGGIFWLGSQTYNHSIDINFIHNTRHCRKKLRGIYYNDARWARLWPLDQETLLLLKQSNPNYSWLSITWWLYTACEEESSKYSVFGYIRYDLTWTPSTTSYIIAWAALDFGTNTYNASGAKDSLQYFNNETPLGYIWDSVGGIGFIGGQISGSQELLNYLNGTWTINSAFSLWTWIISITSNWWFDTWTGASGNAQDTMWNLLVQGNTILSKAVSVFEKKALLGNLEKRTVLLSSSDINSSTVINTAKKNAETLCRGRTYSTFWSTHHKIDTSDSSNDILCYKDSSDLYIDASSVADYANKTIIVKNGNIAINGSMDIDSPSIDLFVDGWSLYLDTDHSTAFNIQGFPVSSGTGVNQGKFLKGNFIINGLLLGWAPGTGKTIDNKLHIQGKFVSLNTPSEPSQGRIDQVTDILWSWFSSRIGLEWLFTWYCDLNSVGSDTTSCWNTELITSTPFVILDGKYPSQIIK